MGEDSTSCVSDPGARVHRGFSCDRRSPSRTSARPGPQGPARGAPQSPRGSRRRRRRRSWSERAIIAALARRTPRSWHSSRPACAPDGATLYVTLEPCCHSGHTGPCTARVIAAGVAPRRRGRDRSQPGRRRPRHRAAAPGRHRGAPGRWPTAATQCEALNEAFARFIRSGLPFITYKAAVSLDGKVAAAGGDARWISSPESRRVVHEMRAAADAVMIGAGTVRRDDPLLTVARRRRGRPGARRREPSRRRTARLAARRDRSRDPHARACRDRSTGDTAAALTRARRRGRAGRGRPARPARRARRARPDRDPLRRRADAGRRVADRGSCRPRGAVRGAALVGRGAPDLVALPAGQAVADGVRLSDVEWTAVGPDMLFRGRVAQRKSQETAGEDAVAPSAGSPQTSAHGGIGA